MTSAPTLARLTQIAALKRERALARLATVAHARARIQGALAGLEPAAALLPDDPHLLSATLAHARWTDSQRRRLLQQLAAITADYDRQLVPARRAFGQAQVLKALHRSARNGVLKRP